MDDNNAFERQIAAELGHMAGPGRQIDAVGMTRSVAITPVAGRWSSLVRRVRGDDSGVVVEGGFSMYSALKLVAGAAVVALFGSFLLSGVLTRQQEATPPPAASPSASPAQPEGFFWSLASEEVEPGVLRLIADAERDFTQSIGQWGEIATTAIAPDGFTWMFGPDTFYRLGDDRVHAWPAGGVSSAVFAANGDIWAADHDGGVHVFDWREGVWETRFDGAGAEDLRFTPDGELWARVEDTIGWVDLEDRNEDLWLVSVRERTGADWSDVGLSDGGAWSVPGDDTIELYRWSTRDWETVPVPLGLEGAAGTGGLGWLEIGPEGSVWATACDGVCWGPWGGPDEPVLTRLDGDEWQTWTRTETGMSLSGQERIDPGGALWGMGMPEDEECGGVVRFDGTETSRYLDGRCVEGLAIGADGSVWLQAFEKTRVDGTESFDDGPVETYVITPGAPGTEV